MEEPEELEAERARGGGGGFGGDVGFGEADKEFKLNAEELEALTVGDEFAGAFEAASERAAEVQKAKAKQHGRRSCCKGGVR